MKSKILAYQKSVRVSPRKMKTMAASIKKIPLGEMVNVLVFTNKKTAHILAKTIKQAIANAKNKNANLENWELDSIQVLKGPSYKRWRAVSRGRGHAILKRTSHIRVTLVSKEIETSVKKAEKPEVKKEAEKKESPIKLLKSKIKQEKKKPTVKTIRKKSAKTVIKKEKK